MKDSHDILAHLLAAEAHPEVRRSPGYVEACRALEGSADLRRDYEEAKAFFHAHPELVRVEHMPADTRERIQEALRRETGAAHGPEPEPLTPWTIRRHFAWAALLVLLLAGMAMMSSHIIQRRNRRELRTALRSLPPEYAFRSYVVQTISHRIPLQERGHDSATLVNWLRERGADPIDLPEELAARKTLGCAWLEGPHSHIALICFGLDKQLVHLFVTPAETLDLRRPHPPASFVLRRRHAVQWNDADHAYLLIAHRPDEPLPPPAKLGLPGTETGNDLTLL